MGIKYDRIWKGKMVMEKFTMEYIIPYYETDRYGRVTPVSLLKYLGETSSQHGDYQGVGFDELQRENHGWILYRWKVRFDHYPSVGDKIVVETWTSGFYKFYAYREFIIYDGSRREIGRATTQWIFLDIERKRPIRIPQKFDKIYNIIDEKVFEGFGELEDRVEVSECLDFNVRKSDIDYNNHVNNAHYLEWVIETIPEDIEERYFLNEFEIVYKKETLYGESIVSQRDEGTDNGDYIIYNHSILSSDGSKQKTMARTIWKKKLI